MPNLSLPQAQGTASKYNELLGMHGSDLAVIKIATIIIIIIITMIIITTVVSCIVCTQRSLLYAPN